MRKDNIKIFLFSLLGNIVSNVILLTIIFGTDKIDVFGDWLISFIHAISKNSELADWLSAIGTLGAIFVALYLPNKEHKSKLTFDTFSNKLFVLNSGRGYNQIRISSVRLINPNTGLSTFSDYLSVSSCFGDSNIRYLTVNPGDSLELMTFNDDFLDNNLVDPLLLEIVIKNMQSEDIVLRLNNKACGFNLISGDFEPIPYP